MESSGLCGFVGNGGAGFGVHSLGDSVQVQTLITNLLKEMCGENGLGDTPRRNEAAELAVTERPWLYSPPSHGTQEARGTPQKVGKPAIPTRRDHWVGWM